MTYSKIEFSISFNIINDVIIHLRKISLLDIKNIDKAYLSKNINYDASVITNYVIGNIVTLILNSLILISIFIYMFLTEPFLCFITFVFSLGYIGLLYRLQ